MMERFSARGRSALGGGNLLRAALALVLVGVLVWALPVRRPGEEGGHHAAHAPAPALDLFERAGITELKEGQRGPAFRLVGLDGREAGLETWSDKAVVLNFWATWCTPCTIEMPTLEALWRGYRDRGLVVLGVSVDRGAPRALIDPYVASLGLTFPILLDGDMDTARAWRVTGLPATFLVRPGGEVAGFAIGAREWDSAEMRALLETMLPGAHAHPPARER
jgi:peroxiredoxin